MSYKLLNRVGVFASVAMLLLCYWHGAAIAQTDGCMSGSGSGSSTSSSGTTAGSTSSGTTVTAQQLSAAQRSLQQLLQSGQLNAAQQQRVTSMLRAVQNAQAGSTFTRDEVRQMSAAMAAARNIAAQQPAVHQQRAAPPCAACRHPRP